MQGLDRDHEPHAVDRGDVAAAPVGGDRDAGLRVDQAALGQRRDHRLDHGHQADVAGAGHQQCGQRDVEVVAAQVRAGDVPRKITARSAGRNDWGALTALCGRCEERPG